MKKTYYLLETESKSQLLVSVLTIFAGTRARILAEKNGPDGLWTQNFEHLWNEYIDLKHAPTARPIEDSEAIAILLMGSR